MHFVIAPDSFKECLTANQGVTSVFALGNGPMSLEESKARAEELLSLTSERIMRLVMGPLKK